MAHRKIKNNNNFNYMETKTIVVINLQKTCYYVNLSIINIIISYKVSLQVQCYVFQFCYQRLHGAIENNNNNILEI